MHSVLIVDDDPLVRKLLAAMMRQKGDFQITEACSFKEGSALGSLHSYDIIFLDHHLRDGIGWEIADMVANDPARCGNPLIILMSGSVTGEEAGNFGGRCRFIGKPFDMEQIEQLLEELGSGSSS